MKQTVSVIRIIVILAIALLLATTVQGQTHIGSKTKEPDTRIWSQAYWLKMAKLGLVEVAPPAAPKEAVYTSSRIDVPGVLTKDSPDVPITDDLNTTQSENSVFVHPFDVNTILNSNNSTDWDGWQVNVIYGTDAFYSTDGGQTWGGSTQGVGDSSYCDPAAAIGLNGWYYVGYIDAYYFGQGVAHSTDGGSTWTHVQVAGFLGMLDKNHLWIDNSPSSPYEGNLYSAWTCFGGVNDGEIELSCSTDSGLSWSDPINISSAVSAGSHNQGVNIQTGPNGEVYTAWAIYDSFPPPWGSDENAIGFAKSTDGGQSFEPAIRIIENIRGVRFTKTSKDMRVNSFPVMAVDISGGPDNGTIYLVWSNIGVPGINVGPDIDVYMIKSTDDGSVWSTPLKVNQDPSGLGKEHFFPWITCDALTGALSVIFYDDRNVSSTDCEVFVASSEDAGQSWSDFKVSDVSFTPSPIPELAHGYFGDYLGLSARGGKVYPAWTDNRDGRAMTYFSPFVMEEDSIPPDAVTDLAVIDLASSRVTLSWTASGDDGGSGRASSYDIRYSMSSINEGNFDLATPVSNPPIPHQVGSTEVFTVEGLDFNTTYYFALKVYDEWGNASGVSNSPWGITIGVPDIDVTPQSLSAILAPEETETQTLVISNLGEDPSTLDFFFSQFDGFLSVEPTQGTVLKGESADISVTFDATGLSVGDYDADIEIFSNDPDEPQATIPAHLHVTEEMLVSFTPTQNQLNIPVNTDIAVKFSRDMDETTINDSTFVVNARSTGLHLGIISYNSGTKTATLNPTDDFDKGEVVTVVLTTGIQSSGGIPLDKSFVWSFTTVANHASGKFDPHRDYAVGDVPVSVFAADLDGDGDLDLVTANEYSNDVSVLSNNGDATFATHMDYAVGRVPQSVTACDLDGDGDIDLATANRVDSVSVLSNNGDGTFGPHSDYAVGDVPRSVFAADLDGDGDIDLATANEYSDNVSVLLNNGNGTFASQTVYEVGDLPSSVTAGDLDGDGDLDLATANEYSDSVSVLLNNGNATFASQTVYEVGDNPSYVTACDLDGDGDLDLATAIPFPSNVSVLLNNGDATFAPYSDYSVGEMPMSVTACDLDGDGDLDLATANHHLMPYYGDVSVLLNNGDATYASHSVYAVGENPRSVIACDLDGDGDLDLATANYHGANPEEGDVSVLLNKFIRGDANGDGMIDLGDVLHIVSYLYKGGPAPDPLAAGDVDCSGGLDLGDVLYLIAYLYKGGPAPGY